MKFLCLHGMGTSANIFKVQLGPIINQLRKHGHEFVFVNGVVECEAPIGVKQFFPGPYCCYYSLPQQKQLMAAKALIEKTIDRQGPFDAVIGFSQGAALASSLMLEHKKENPYDDLFGLAVFMGASMPFDMGEERIAKPSELTDRTPLAEVPFQHRTDLQVRYDTKTMTTRGAKIEVPTIHIIGDADEYVLQSRDLARICTGEKTVVGHREGHWIPRDVPFTTKAAKAIQDVVDLIESMN